MRNIIFPVTFSYCFLCIRVKGIKVPEVPHMKCTKLLKSFTAALLILPLAGCTQKTETADTPAETEETAGISIANPFVHTDTVEEAEKGAGFEIGLPEAIEGFEERTITFMEGYMIQAVYGSENTVTVRKAKDHSDISGDYNTYKEEAERQIAGKSVTVRMNDDGIHNLTWTDGEYSYAAVSDTGLSEETAEMLVSSVR